MSTANLCSFVSLEWRTFLHVRSPIRFYSRFHSWKPRESPWFVGNRHRSTNEWERSNVKYAKIHSPIRVNMHRRSMKLLSVFNYRLFLARDGSTRDRGARRPSTMFLSSVTGKWRRKSNFAISPGYVDITVIAFPACTAALYIHRVCSP